MTMTSRERLLAAMRFEKVDRVPVAPFTLGALAPDSDIARELIEKTDPFIETGIGGNPLWGVGPEVTTTVDGDTTTYVWHTPKGPLTQRIRNTGITSANVEYLLKTPEDAEKFLSIDYVPGDLNISLFQSQKEHIREEGLVLAGMPDAVVLPAILLSPEDLCLWWMDYPDLLIELTSIASKRLNDWVRLQCEAGVDAFRIVGGEYASVQLGPSGFDALVLEQDRELVDIIHKYGAIAYYHNHGPVMNYLSRFCEIGMDFLDPLEAPPWADADLSAARSACGERVCFVGNLDDMEIINKMSAEQVLAIAEERLDAAGERGFVLGGTASGTYTEHAARNFMAMAELSAKRAG